MSQTPRTIALIAHDGKKADLVAFAQKHKELLGQFRLVATGTTGKMLETHVGFAVERCLSGPLGGDVQIAARVVDKEVHAVIFFVDPLDKHPHEPDIQTLLRACNVHDIPLATNASTARMVVTSRDVGASLVSAGSEG